MLFPPRALSADAQALRFGARYKWIVLMVVGMGIISAALTSSGFVVAIPALMRHFGLGQEQAQWTISAFMAAMAIGMLPTSWILDRIGFRKLFLGAVTTLILTGVAGSFSTHFPVVVFVRILQGAAAGTFLPLGTLVVMRLFPVSQQGRASGMLGFGVVLAPALGPTLGGMLIDRFGWHSIFLINLPVCLLAGLLGLYLLPLPREIVRRDFDWIGIGLLTIASLTTVAGIASMQQQSATVYWAIFQLALSAAFFFGFVLYARKAVNPIITLSLFRQPSFAMGILVCFAYGFSLYAWIYLIPVFLQHALHYSATASGLALLPSGFALALTIPLAGRIVDRYTPQLVTIAGLTTFCLSYLYIGETAARITYPEIIAATVLAQIGMGFVLPAMSLATLRHLESHQFGQSSVLVSYARQFGGVLGVSGTAVFVVWREAAIGDVSAGISNAYKDGFLMVAGVLLLAIVAASLMNIRSRQ